MFSRSKKLLRLSGISRAEKKARGLRASDAGQTTTGAQAQAAVERVRMAMSGAMQACLDSDKASLVDEAQAAGGILTAHERVDGQVNAQVDMLQRQLRSARDLDTLWYLRPGLMNVIAVRQGEVAARDCLVALTALFKQHQPGGRSTRPGTY